VIYNDKEEVLTALDDHKNDLESEECYVWNCNTCSILSAYKCEVCKGGSDLNA